MTCSLKTLADTLAQPAGKCRDASARSVAKFVSRALHWFHQRFPQANERYIVVLEDMADGTHTHFIPDDTILFFASVNKGVDTYMATRFAARDPDGFDPDVHTAEMVCFDRDCKLEDARVGVMVYNACALRWVAHHNGVSIKDAINKLQRMAARRNQFALSWSELLNLTGVKNVICTNCQGSMRVADVKHCGACCLTTYCLRACQKGDWSQHKGRCFPGPAAHARVNPRFVAFYSEVYKSTDVSADAWCEVGAATARFPKRTISGMPPALRSNVEARNKRISH
jgi:hypothetical protein